jgi:hypothetical protein
VSTLRARKDHVHSGGRSGKEREHAHLDSLVANQLETGASVFSATPIPPEQWGRTNRERMQQHADLTRLFGGAPIPLALLTQFTRTTPANTGGIHQPQAPISLLPPLLERKRIACWAAQGPVRLERKILSCEATRFPGGGCGRWGISRSRSRCGRMRGSLHVLLRDGGSELGDAQGRWL